MTEKLTIKAIKDRLASADLTAAELASFRQDERKGVISAVNSYDKKQARLAQKQLEFEKRLEIERSFWRQGITYIAGIDEVGRGPLAGPVVSAAVILPPDFALSEVNDSKQLSPKKREELYGKILEQALAVGIGVASNKVIDEVNIYQASRLAMKEAVDNLQIQPQQLIIDAMTIDSTIPQLKLIKADAKSASVAAASIIAKVYRDHLMQFYERVYPGYGFVQNDGYGTKQHLAGLAKLGPSPIHRHSFEPVKKALQK